MSPRRTNAWFLAAPLVAFVGVALAVWLTRAHDAPPLVPTMGGSRSGLAEGERPDEPPLTGEVMDVERQVLEIVPLTSSEDGHEGPPVFPGIRPRGQAEVTVRTELERPAAGASVEIRSELGARPPGFEIDDGRGVERSAPVDESGRVVFEELPAGAYAAVARMSGGRWGRTRFIVRGEATARASIALHADPTREFAVRVVDEEGAPVAGVTVDLAGSDRVRGVFSGSPAQLLHATTDVEGRAVFAGLDLGIVVIIARAPDGRAAQLIQHPGREREQELAEGGVRVVLAEAASLHGRLVGVEPVQLADARIVAHALTSQNPYYWTFGAAIETAVVDGTYRFESLPAGTWSLTLESPAGVRLVLAPFEYGGPLENSLQPLVIELVAGLAGGTQRDLEVAQGGILEGRVTDERGLPVPNSEIRTTFAPHSSDFPDSFTLLGVNVWRYDSDVTQYDAHPTTHRNARTDSDGRYRLGGLPPGAHRVEVYTRHLTMDRREGIVVRDNETTRLEHTLAPAGVLAGVDRAGTYLGVTKIGEAAPRMIVILSDTREFTFPGLEAGMWELAQFHSTAALGKVPLATAEVVAGRTTWVDLASLDKPFLIEGRVLAGSPAVPVVGANVQVIPELLQTDAEGWFRTTRSWPSTGGVSLAIRHGPVLHKFELPGVDAAATAWTREIELGSEALEVVTRDSSGTRVAATVGIQAWAFTDAATGRGSVSASISSDFDGRASFRDLPRGRYSVRVEFADRSTVDAEVDLPSTEPLVLNARPAGKILVHCDVPDGIGWTAYATTWIADGAPPNDPDEFRKGGASSSAAFMNGMALLEGVRSGLVLVEAHRTTGFMGTPVVAQPQRIRLEANATADVHLQRD